MFKKPNIDKEDIEFYLNEYVLNDGDFFSVIKKIKVDKILKEQIATRWNPLTKSNTYQGWDLKVKLTFFIPDGLLDDEKDYFKDHEIGKIFQKEVERFNYSFKGDFLKKYLNYQINEFTYDGDVEELRNEKTLTELIKKVLKTL